MRKMFVTYFKIMDTPDFKLCEIEDDKEILVTNFITGSLDQTLLFQKESP